MKWMRTLQQPRPFRIARGNAPPSMRISQTVRDRRVLCVYIYTYKTKNKKKEKEEEKRCSLIKRRDIKETSIRSISRCIACYPSIYVHTKRGEVKKKNTNEVRSQLIARRDTLKN